MHSIIIRPSTVERAEQVFASHQRRVVSVGNRPGRVMGPRQMARTGRPMTLGQGQKPTRGPYPDVPGDGVPSAGAGCITYPDPGIPQNAAGCDIGYLGCGDTVGIDQTILAGATVDVQVQAAIVFTPRLFAYLGPAATFAIADVKVANGGTSHFGPAFSVDYYATTSFTGRWVSWPTFYAEPRLLLSVTNLTGADADFSGVLFGSASHP